MRVLAHQPVGPSRRWSVLPCCDAISSITNSPRPTGSPLHRRFRNPPPSRIPTQRPRSPPTRGPLAPPRRGRPSAALVKDAEDAVEVRRFTHGELRHLRHTAAQPLNLCHRARGVSPFQHGIVSSTRPLPIRTNITRQGKPLKAVRHNMRPNPPPAGQANNEGAHGTGAALQPSRQACHLSKL